MDDNYGLTQPGPDASPGAWTAYRQAYSARAMQEHHQHLQKLMSELREKVRYSECERALAAFNQVLVAAGVDASDAAHAQFKLESWDDAGFPDDEGFTEDEGRAAVAWRDAFEGVYAQTPENSGGLKGRGRHSRTGWHAIAGRPAARRCHDGCRDVQDGDGSGANLVPASRGLVNSPRKRTMHHVS